MINTIAQNLSLLTCILLLSLGIVFNISLKFFYITKIGHIKKSIFERNPNANISPFSAVTLALAGTLGVGNIVGVASSIYLGGPGSIFWMWIGALFSMVLKYSEVLLSIKHRKKINGSYLGGAFSYIKPQWLSSLFAFLCIIASFSIGNFLQTNTLSDILISVYEIPKILTGIFTFIILTTIITRNIKIITQITTIAIPLASLAYMFLCLGVVISNYTAIPKIINIIISSAFNLKSCAGGTLGFTFIKAMRFGISRGLITNEAGCGTAPIAHACADTDSCVKQGFWGIFEVFFDTFVLCSLTAFVILSDPNKNFGFDITYILNRFSSVFGRISDPILTLCIIIFALSTLIGWSQYGILSLKVLCNNKKCKQAYLIIYALLAIIGSIITSELMWNIADITISIMTIINSTYLLTKIEEIKSETVAYFKPHGKEK